MIKIRKAKKEDKKSIIDLCDKHKKIIISPLPLWNKFYVAEKNGMVIGCCAVEIYSSKIAEIRSLVVLKEHQNKGIAEKLVNCCCKKASRVKEIFVITSIPGYFKKHKFDFCQGEKYILFKKK